MNIAADNGRTLEFAEFGDLGGKPVFYFHGFPGSRLEAEIAEPAAIDLNLRIIALDRPGYGLSGFQPDRKILDWPSDVVKVADTLELGSFSIVGISGGGPYAAVCAHEIPARLENVAIVCGLGPVNVPGNCDGMMWQNRIGLSLARFAPLMARVIYRAVSSGLQHFPERFVANISKSLPDPDNSVLQETYCQELLLKTFQEAYRFGSEGSAWDLTLYCQPWGFRLEDISCEVSIWQGERDIVVPATMAKHMENAIPKSRANYLADEGHYSLITRHLPKILEDLAS